MPTIISSDNAFSTEELTLRANEVERFPAVRTPTSGLFEIDNVSDRAVSIDYESAALTALTDGTWGTVLPKTAVNRDRRNFSLNAVKVGKTFDVLVGEIQSVRQTGEVTRESLQTVQDRKAGRVFTSIEDYHERARIAAFDCKVIRNDGSVAADLRDAAYYNVVANPTIGLQLDAADPEPGSLRRTLSNAKRLVELSLKIGDAHATGFDIQANSDLHDLLRTHPETMELYARWQDLAQPTEGTELPFRFAGWNFYDYKRAGIASGAGLGVPRGVPGMFKTFFTPGDFMHVLNMPGMARYLSVEELDHGKGFEYEASTNALHICNRPEGLFKFDAGAGDVSGDALAALVATAQEEASTPDAA